MRFGKLFLIFSLLCACRQVKAQNIPKWKIEDVVNYYSKPTDSIYVINFWAAFCKPCIQEIPCLQSISAKYKTQKIALLLVSLDLPVSYPDTLISFVTKNNITASVVWLDEDDVNHFCPPIDKNWMDDIPATLFINAKTGYRFFIQEELTPEKFETELQKAITGTVIK